MSKCFYCGKEIIGNRATVPEVFPNKRPFGPVNIKHVLACEACAIEHFPQLKEVFKRETDVSRTKEDDK